MIKEENKELKEKMNKNQDMLSKLLRNYQNFIKVKFSE